MAPNGFNKTFLMGILAVTFSITTFLLKTWFDGVNANAIELIRLKESNAKLWAQVDSKNENYRDRFNYLDKKLDSIDIKLSELLKRK